MHVFLSRFDETDIEYIEPEYVLACATNIVIRLSLMRDKANVSSPYQNYVQIAAT